MESVTLDDVDRRLVHALQADARAPFSAIGEALGVSENTAARRYRRLRSAGSLKVVGSTNGFLLGYTSWTIRVRCTPDAADPIARALARRPDTFWVHILSGGTEISCNVQTRTDDQRDALLMDKLPRTGKVLDISAHAILSDTDEHVTLHDGDHALLAALAQDGRASYTDLAARTGQSESTVRRRIEYLRDAGVLVFDVDVPPAALGLHAQARLWMSVRPKRLLGVADTMAGHAETSFTAITTGRTNLVAAVACPSEGALFRYLTHTVGALGDIQTLESAPVIRTVKRAG